MSYIICECHNLLESLDKYKKMIIIIDNKEQIKEINIMEKTCFGQIITHYVLRTINPYTGKGEIIAVLPPNRKYAHMRKKALLPYYNNKVYIGIYTD